MKKILACNSDFTGCGWYRVVESYSNLKIPGAEIKIDTNIGGSFDALLIQRPVLDFLPRLIKELQGKGVVVVVDTDDDLTQIAPNNPAYGFYKDKIEVYKKCLDLADYIHVSTPELQKEIGRGEVFYNGIHFPKYANPLPKIKNSIMWAGSHTHTDSMAIIRPHFAKLLKKHNIILMSDLKWLRSHFPMMKNLTRMDYVPTEQYYLVPSMAEVFLTPLPDTKFNSSKSEIKCLEAAAWGVPCVSSSTAPYLRFNSHHGANLLDEWVDNVERLFEDKEFYRRQSELSLLTAKKYDLAVINEKRKIFWEKVLDL